MKTIVMNRVKKAAAVCLGIVLIGSNVTSFASASDITDNYDFDFSGSEIQTAVITDNGEFVSSTSVNIPSVIEEKRRIEEEKRRIEEEERRRIEEEERLRIEEEERVLQGIKAVEIEATANRSANVYSSRSMSKKVGSVKSGDGLIYIDHVETDLAYVKVLSSGIQGYIDYSAVNISSKNYTINEDFPNRDKDVFVNAKGYDSETDYLVWVNVERQKVNVFLGEKGNWKIERAFDCATGANATLTPTGEYTHTLKSSGWYNPTYIVRPVLYIDTGRGIAFHSILHNLDGSIQDGTLGRPVSHGCIRMADEDINWMYTYIPIGTKVVVW